MIIYKDNIKILLIILILGLGIGYAYINSDLNINGTAQVNSANWDIHWANIQVASGSVSGTNVVTAPTISNSTTVNYSVILNTPGDYYEFTIDAVNAGTIDAMIDTIDSKLNGATITTLPAYLNYTVTYSDGIELEPNHELLANTTETYKVRVEYSTDINLNQIPATNQTLSLQFTVTYRQATSESIERDRYVYTVNLYDDLPNGNMIEMNQAIPNNITVYNSAAEAMAALSSTVCLKHKRESGIITESYVEFIITAAEAQANPGLIVGTYILRGAGATYNTSTGNYNSDSPYYAQNKAALLSAFGSSYCTETSVSYYCSIPHNFVIAEPTGYTYVQKSDWLCDIQYDGSSSCNYG